MKRSLLWLAVAAVVAVLVWREVPGQVQVTQLRAVSSDAALVLVRERREDGRHWLTLMSPEGSVWKHRLPDDTAWVAQKSLAASTTRVTYRRARTDHVQEVIGLDRETGREVWRRVVGASNDAFGESALFGSTTIDDLLLAPVRSDWLNLMALSLEDGEIRWRESFTHNTLLLDVHTDSIWMHDGEEDALLLRLSLESGRTTRHTFDSGLPPCLLDDRFYAIEDGFLRTDGAVPLQIPVVGLLSTCGWYGESLILGVQSDLRVVLVKIEGGRVSDAPLPIDDPLLRHFSRLDVADVHPLRSDMTRFLPLVDGNGDGDTTRWQMVDLETMQRVHGNTVEGPGRFEHARVDSVHYFTGGRALLIAVDGQTGTLTGAIHGPAAFQVRHVVDGTLWLASRDPLTWTPWLTPPVTRLDGRTLTPLDGPLPEGFTDARDEAAAMTGWSLP